ARAPRGPKGSGRLAPRSVRGSSPVSAGRQAALHWRSERRAMAEATPNQLAHMWRKQVEESTQAWTRLVSQRAPTMAPPDPTAFWRPVLDQGLETWAKLFAQTPATPELLPQWKQFIDQWIEAWSKVLGQAMGTEQFAKLMGQSLDQFLATHGPLRRAAEQQTEQALKAPQLPSRSPVTAVRKMTGAPEERMERP